MTTGVRQASGAVALLRAVHDRPGILRAAAASELHMTSGFVTETIARLASLRLVGERPAPPSGGRGRPTTTLHPHPQGPLVVAAAIGHETWRVAVTELGGGELSRVERPHRRDPSEVLGAVGAALHAVRRRHGGRIRAVAVAVPGTVSGHHLVQAANLGWSGIDLATLWPRERNGRSFLAGNDASFAAVAEARRGAAAGAGTILHLFVDAGIGGAVIEDGRLLVGATGTAGEFGHMPFGDPTRPCRCGARGCWNTSVEGAALARALGEPAPPDEVTYTRQVLALARAANSSRPEALDAVEDVARSIGRGAAGLVNAFDPEIVTVGGVGRDLLDVAGGHLRSAYLAGLMRFHAVAPPPVVPARLGDDAPLIGASEEAFATVLTDHGLRAWSSQPRRPAST